MCNNLTKNWVGISIACLHKIQEKTQWSGLLKERIIFKTFKSKIGSI